MFVVSSTRVCQLLGLRESQGTKLDLTKLLILTMT